MIRHYLKTAWRNLMRNKVFSFINIMGLTIGITVCLMIFLFITSEFSFDNFHKQGNQIYRVMRNTVSEGKDVSVAYLSGPYAPALLNDFKGEIGAAVRVNATNGLVTINNRGFTEKKIINVDSNFFNFFTFPLIKGDPGTVLKDPSSVVLTERAAKKYFGSSSNAFGKILKLDNELDLKVTGIAKNVPTNSHLDFDMVVPIANYEKKSYFDVWVNNAMYTYVKLNPGITKEQVQRRFPEFMDKYMGETMQKYGFHFSLFLTPLSDVYFSKPNFDSVRHGDKKVVFIFLSIAILILVIACINFMNLSTIRAVDRAKEIGLRKVLGAYRRQLMGQFIGESLFITIISCFLALVILWMVMPLYNQLLGYELAINWSSWQPYALLLGIIVCVGGLSGCYPAFYLSGFSPVASIKGKLNLGKGGVFFRQSLVVVQFTISVLLMIGTIIIMYQMRYVRQKDLGYNKEQSMVVRIDNMDIYQNRMLFKQALENEPGIASVSLMSGEPGGFFDGYYFDVEGQHEKWNARTEYTDFQYVKTLGLKIIAGRDFSVQYPTDSAGAVLINQTAAAKLGWTDQEAIGKWIRNTSNDSLKRRIVGVIQDFSFLSLKENMMPLVIAPGSDHRLAIIRLKGGDIHRTVSAVKKDYALAAPAYPFEYSFLNQQFDDMYSKDIKQQTILSIFSGLAILIACLGLFGLATYTTTQRIKEIGVRKVLGSSVRALVVLISKDLLKPVIIATLLALPIGYMVMNKWLHNFAYHTPLHWWFFALAVLITFGIALVTVSIKALKAAAQSPVTSLQSE